VHDNGPQFTGKEFRELIKRFSLEEIRIRVYHPESNGNIERFHGVLRQEGLSDQELKHQLHAQDIIGRWVEHYNQERQHAALAYLTPQDWLLERQQTRLAERQQKLAAAQKTPLPGKSQTAAKGIGLSKIRWGRCPQAPRIFRLGGKTQLDSKGQLYNIADDPGERKNVYAEDPEIVQRLTELLERYRRDGRSWLIEQP
jgi:Integrase core domain